MQQCFRLVSALMRDARIFTVLFTYLFKLNKYQYLIGLFNVFPTMAIYLKNPILSLACHKAQYWASHYIFVIAFNDRTDVIRESRIIMYADDVILYVAADIRTINSKLSKNMKRIAN